MIIMRVQFSINNLWYSLLLSKFSYRRYIFIGMFCYIMKIHTSACLPVCLGDGHEYGLASKVKTPADQFVQCLDHCFDILTVKQWQTLPLFY